MISLGGADGAVGVDVLVSPGLVALLFERAVGLYKVVFPAILTGALEFAERGRRGVSPHIGAPAIIRALGGDKGDPGLRGIRQRRSGGVKEQVVDTGVDIGTEQVALARDFLFPSVAEGSFSTGKDTMLNPFLYDRGMIAADLGYDADVFKSSKSIVY